MVIDSGPVGVTIRSPTSTACVLSPSQTTRNSSAFQMPSAPGVARGHRRCSTWLSNTTEAASYIPGVSPYVASNFSLNKPATTNTPAPMATAACANGDFSCISGVGVQQNAPLSQQARDAIAATAAAASR